MVDDLTEKRRLEAQRQLFERMVSPAVIEAKGKKEPVRVFELVGLAGEK